MIIRKLEDNLSEHDIKIILTDKCKEYIIDSAYDINYGVRPLKRFISRNIETLIAKELINNEIKYGDTVKIDYKNDKLILERE